MSAVGDLNHELHRSYRVLNLVRGELSTLLPPSLDPAAAQLLIMLVKQGPARQNELAEGTLLDPSTISRRVSQLVEHHLAERLADPQDGRAVRLAATPSGATLVERLRTARDRITADVLDDWTEDDVRELATLMRRFNDAVNDHRRQNSRGEQ